MPKLLSIIIPIYNEEKIIAASLPAILSLSLNKEVIIVNDGSSDNTLFILKELTKKYSFNLVNQLKNQGKGAAIKRGLEEAKGDYFIICDADLEYNPQDIIFLFQEIEKIHLGDQFKKIAIYGSRFLLNKSWTFHYFINKVLTTLTNLLFNAKLTDMETCFKLIPLVALEKIKLNGGRFEIEPEITAKLLKNGYQIIEHPIDYDRRGYLDGKKIKAKDGFLAIKTLIIQRFT